MVNLGQDLQQQLIAKALKDEAFQQQLLENPKATLQTWGVNIPENIEIQVLRETPNQVYLILPQNLSVNADNELSSEQLEAVAGGLSPAKADTGCIGGGERCGIFPPSPIY